jgi:hypothetical protein
VVQKETSKIQFKQQIAAAGEKSFRNSLEAVLSRWGLASASYLAAPGHERAIAILAENPMRAAALIDRTMRQGSWTDGAGVGARVAFIRENVGRVAARLEAEANLKGNAHEECRRRAEQIADELIRNSSTVCDRVESERSDSLLRRGLERLDERPQVLKALVENPAVRRSLVASELEREALSHELDAMPDGEFRACCDRLFTAHPGFQRLYGNTSRESKVLRLSLLEFLWKERKGGAETGGPSHEVELRDRGSQSIKAKAALVSHGETGFA